MIVHRPKLVTWPNPTAREPGKFGKGVAAQGALALLQCLEASASYPHRLLKDVDGVSMEISWLASKPVQHSSQSSFLLCGRKTGKSQRGKLAVQCPLNRVPFGSRSWEIQLYPFALTGERVHATKPAVKCTAMSSWAKRQERIGLQMEPGSAGRTGQEGWGDFRHPPSTAESTPLFIKA